MKIIILGAGQVGSSVAEALCSEANDITVVDTEPARLKVLQDRLDLRTVTGNAAHPLVLTQAGAADADLIFAVTRSDETNLVACKLAAKLFNTPTRIARIRAADYLSHPEIFGPDCLAVDHAGAYSRPPVGKVMVRVVMRDPQYLDDARRIGLDTNWLGSAQIDRQIRQIQETPQPVVDRLRDLLARAGVK